MSLKLAGRPLTPKDKKIVVEMSHGNTAKEVGGVYGMTLRAVQMRWFRIIKKLEVKNGVEAVAKCLREGIIE